MGDCPFCHGAERPLVAPGPADFEVGVLMICDSELDAFSERVFLSGADLDENDHPDDQSPLSFYFVPGYSASRTQVKASLATRQIEQTSFHCATNPVDSPEYIQERVSQGDHVVLDFDLSLPCQRALA